MTRTLTFVFFTVFLCAFLYLKTKGITHFADDIWFANESHTPDIFSWLEARYLGWSSRTPIEFALLKVINHTLIWAFFNAFFIAATVCSFAWLSAKNNKNFIYFSLAFLLIVLFTIKKGYIHYGILWMTGSLNYLWPFSLAIIGFALLKSHIAGKDCLIRMLSIAGLLFFSSFSEQMVIINLVMLFTVALIYRERARKATLISLIATLLVFMYIVLSPGNANRLHLEIPRWMPDFVNLNFIDKVLMGLNLAFDQMFTVQPIAIIIIYLCLALVFRSNKRTAMCALLLLITTIILSLIERKVFAISNLDTIYEFTSETITGYYAIARAATVIVFAIATTFLLFQAQKERKTAWLVVIAYFASYSATVMLGLSPTIYASGQRVLMVSGLMVSALAAYLVIQSISEWRTTDRIKLVR